MFRILCFLLAVCIMTCTAHAKAEWPGKKEGTSLPYNSYVSGSCGSYIRADDALKLQYRASVLGYVTALNSKLERGGDVLGYGVSVSDYMMLVDNYCAENPTEFFLQSVHMTLRKLTPIDWQGHVY